MEVGPTEETVEALLDYLVEPYLSLVKSKAASRETPSISQQHLIAKQVHAVVLLYNYYHRKYHPALEILTFQSFCKLAVLLKPNLMPYMSLMYHFNYSKINDLENQLSHTEKAVMDACDISLALDASNQVPKTEGWPISKVAILLVDSRKEKCMLFLGSVTAGVWSIIEKDLDVGDMNCETKRAEKHVFKRMSFPEKLPTTDQNAYESHQKLALLTVEKVAGINQDDLIVLESRAVYSLSKEKASSHFYIMQCAQPSNEDFQVPIKEVVERLQGPLVKKTTYGWVVTPAVEFFHMLPYVGTIQDWLSREKLPDGVRDLKVDPENVHLNNYPLAENSNKVDELGAMDMEDLLVLHSPNKDNAQSVQSVVKVHEHAAVDNMMAEAEVVELMSRSCTTGPADENLVSRKQYSISLSVPGTPSGNNELVPLRPNSQHLESLECVLASKEDALSQTALKVLLRKREQLSFELRNLTDQIALCDKTIKTMQQGCENNLNVEIQVGNQERRGNGQPESKRKKFSEAVVSMRNSCQELDDICHLNNWKLPTYHTFPSTVFAGGFLSSVTVKGYDFELTIQGNTHPGCRDAMESAATHMITKLHGLIGQRE